MTLLPLLTVSIVTHNESRDAERLLESLEKQTYRDFAIEAIDNNSEDGTRSLLKGWERSARLPLRVTDTRRNLGYTGGHNLGIEAAIQNGSRWVLVLNTDLVLAPDFIETLLEAAEAPRHERTASFTGKILRAHGPDLAPARDLDSVGIWMTRNGRHFDIGSGLPDDGRFDREAEVFGVSGCTALFRVSALTEVKIATGYFDDDFFLYREDVDLAWRLRLFGWSACSIPRALAWHRRRGLPQNRSTMPAFANMHSVKNRFLLRINNAGQELILSTLGPTLFRDLTVAGGCLLTERTSLPAFRWLLDNRPRLGKKRRDIQGRRTVSDKELLPWFTQSPEGAWRPLSR